MENTAASCTMEVEDPIAAKFQSLLESLMAKTTSEIVKVFAEVLLETRVEISRSWREIDELKQKLEKSEEKRAEDIFRSETNDNFKRETEEELVSHETPQIVVSDTISVRPAERGGMGVVQIVKNGTIENTGSVIVHQPATSQATLDTSDINQSISSLDQSQETRVSQTVVKRKRGRLGKSSKVKELQKCIKRSVVASESPLQDISVVDHEQPSSSTGIIILGKNGGQKGAVVTRKKYIQKKPECLDSISTTHTLRDRNLLSNQRSCLCCPSDQCSLQERPTKISSQAVSQVCTSSKGRYKIHEGKQFGSHKPSTLHKCSRCGQIFTNVRSLTAHKRSVHPSTKPFPYCCYLCGHMFATQCGWNMHKRIHAHSNLLENDLQETAKPSEPHTLPKELKAKVEVRLERISHAQLEAALCPKGAFLQDENSPTSEEMVPNSPSPLKTSATAPSGDPVINTAMSCKESGSQTMTKAILASRSDNETGKKVKQLDETTDSDETTETVIPTGSGQIQPTRKGISSEPLPVPSVPSAEHEEGPSRGTDCLTKGLNSMSRKRKMSDCNHDIYNGVFPVEKILRWRSTKGRNEVRVKWMPCSLCGAKWKNTWEPAESFTPYTDSKNEDEK